MSNQLISIVVPTFREEGNVEKLFTEVKAALKGEKFEIIYVNDGSPDRSLDVIKGLAKKNPEVRYISFSRNFGHQAALRAGLSQAKGDAVISMDADLQHPPAMLPELIAKWREGYEVVATIRQTDKKLSLSKRLTSTWYYRVLNFLAGLHLKEGAADFRLLDKKVVKVINDQQESELFLRGYIEWLGFNQVSIPYMPAPRFSGATTYTYKKMFKLAGQGITQFSVKPLRVAFVLSVLAFMLSFLYVIYAIWAAFVANTAVPGWLSLVVLFVFLQGIQFMLIGLIGEYLGRTFMQTKHRPEFIVSETSEDETVR